MMRSLWTAASGMRTQQLNLDTVSNNLANVNTTGYKKERLEFKDLIYETMRTARGADQLGAPINLQVGHGVKAAGTARMFTQGNLERTDNPLDVAIDGQGFFSVRLPNGEIKYSKNGSFKLSLSEDGLMLANNNGYPILNTDDEVIIIPDNLQIKDIIIDEAGILSYQGKEGPVLLDSQLSLVQFINPVGLKSLGNSLFETTPASGEAMKEIENEELKPSTIMQGTLEMSNVQVVDEMVKMIVSQRAYEINSKAIQTSDEMLSLANQLKR